MASESNHVVALDHFEGGANLQRGGEKALADRRSGQSLARILRRERHGRFTAAGAGDTAIVFDVPFDDENFTVLVTGDATSLPVLKADPTVGTGFTITAAGAGPVHWLAVYDGPTE
jgi:hypothetical protein